MMQRETQRAPIAQWHPGGVVSGYLLEKHLGSGASADVFCAVQQETGQRVALKISRPGPLRPRELRHRYVQELEASRRLQHPNVVELYDVISTPAGWPVLVMEYVRGVTLHRVLRGQAPLSLRHGAGLGMTLARTLHHLHQGGLVHRGVAPEDIMFTRTPKGELTFKLLDLARLGESLPTLQAGESLPGVLPGEEPQKTDIHSLGEVLWWALTGEPWQEPRGESAGLLLRRKRPEVPGAIAQLVQRMLAGHSDQLPTPQQVHRAMHHWLRELHVEPERSPRPAPTPPAPPAQTTRPVPPPAPHAPRVRPQAVPTGEPQRVHLVLRSADAGAWSAALRVAESSLLAGLQVTLLVEEGALPRQRSARAVASWPLRGPLGWRVVSPPRRPSPGATTRQDLQRLVRQGLLLCAPRRHPALPGAQPWASQQAEVAPSNALHMVF